MKADAAIRDHGLTGAAELALAPFVRGEEISPEAATFARRVYKRLKAAHRRKRDRMAARGERGGGGGLKESARQALRPLVKGQTITAEEQRLALQLYERLKAANARKKDRNTKRDEDS